MSSVHLYDLLCCEQTSYVNSVSVPSVHLYDQLCCEQTSYVNSVSVPSVHLYDLLCCEQTRKVSEFPSHQVSDGSGDGGGVDDDDSDDNDDGCPFVVRRKTARAAWLWRRVGAGG